MSVMSLRNIANMETVEEPLCTSVSEYSPKSYFNDLRSSFAGSLLKTFTQYDVYSLVIKEVQAMAEKLEYLEEEYSQNFNKYKSRSRSFSTSKNEEYRDILLKKQYFIAKLTDAVNISPSLGIPKYKVQCCQQLFSLLSKQSIDAKLELQQQMGQLKQLKEECSLIGLQKSNCSDLIQEQIEQQENREPIQIGLLFEEAKKDLNDVVNIVLPNAEVKSTFIELLQMLLNACEGNVENEDDQFVEISPLFTKNKGLKFMIAGGVIICHPHDTKKFRLCIEE